MLIINHSTLVSVILFSTYLCIWVWALCACQLRGVSTYVRYPNLVTGGITRLGAICLVENLSHFQKLIHKIN